MAEFLNTQGVSYKLSEIINNAKERIVIISPYLQINDLIKRRIERKIEKVKEVEVCVIFREDRLKPEENDWLKSKPSIKTGILKNLHAKCYMNEDEALITSMNLYEYSEVRNYEMGISVSREEDHELYEKIKEESESILWECGITKVTVDRVEPVQATEEKTRKKSSTPLETPVESTVEEPFEILETSLVGFCIRCKDELPANPTRPYCSNCYAIWKRYKNEGYKEKYCHICGSEYTTTLLKPLCLTCDRELEDVLEFIAF